MFDDSRICASPNDTCLVPPAPGFILGRFAAVCGHEFQYRIDTMSRVTGYTWTLTGAATIDSGQGTAAIWVSYADTFTTGTINIYATDSCGSGMPRTLAVTGYPAAPDSISGPSAVCAFATSVSFSCDSSFGGTIYTWVVPSGCTIDSGQGTTRIVVDWDSIPGSVIVTVSDSCGSSDSTFYAVGIAECRLASKHSITSSMPASGDIKLYPNPTTGEVTVIYNLNGNYGLLQLYDVTGRLMGSYKLDGNKNTFEFNADYLCCGVFEYRVLDDNALRSDGKLIIIR